MHSGKLNSGFKDPIAVKRYDNSSKEPSKFVNGDCPVYDKRTSSFVNQGTHYGVGHAQPIGTEKHSISDVVPMGRVKTMRSDNKG